MLSVQMSLLARLSAGREVGAALRSCGGGGGGGTLSLQLALLRVSAPSLQARSFRREFLSLPPSDRGLTAACRFFVLFSVFRFSSFVELIWTNNLFS